MSTACNAITFESNSIGNESKLSAAELKKMQSRDFYAHVTLEIMEGKLKGTHVFKRKPEVKNQLMQIRVNKSPEDKEGASKPGLFYIGTIAAENPDYFLISLSKNFTGVIKEGSYPSSRNPSPFVIQNKNQSSLWKRAHGKLQTHSDITLSEVGEWLAIRGKREVRRVKGHFTDQVEFTFNDSNSSLSTETVAVKVTFSIVEVYRPKRY